MAHDSDEQIRRRWLARLGQAVDLSFPFFPIAGVHARGAGLTIVTGELATGRIAVGDELEAAGYRDDPLTVRVVRIERPDEHLRAVGAIERAVAGDVLGLTLAHDAETTLEPGQCVAPAGRLRVSSRVEADVWIVPADDLPVGPGDARRLLEELAAGRGPELFFYSRAIAARVDGPWSPQSGVEYRLGFTLERPVALHDGARFGLTLEGLTIGAGFVLEGGGKREEGGEGCESRDER